MRQTQIQSTLSPVRLQRFVVAAGGSVPRALKLYRWNAQVASAYWTPLHFMEVAVRNAVHDAMAESREDPWWLRSGTTYGGAPRLYPFEREGVAKALAKLYEPLTPGKAVAELHFGFWVGLLSGRYLPAEGGADYHNLIWVKGGVANRFAGAKRGTVFKRLDRLRRFRNRVAHHEHLLDANLDVISADIDMILRALCPDTAIWVRAMSDVAKIRSRKP